MVEEQVIDLAVDVPGTPLEVWDAIATGPGLGSWFVPAEVDGRVGGLMEMDFGRFGTESARITVWEPPNRLAYEGRVRTGGILTHDWQVEQVDPAACTVRLVNGGFSPASQQNPEIEDLFAAWPVFLGNLRLRLTHFRGMHARPITPTSILALDHDEAWEALCEELGIATDLAAGSNIATSGSGVPMLHGIIEDTLFVPGTVSGYVILMDTPTPGTAFITAEGGGESTVCSVWLYLYGDDVAELEDRWTPFIEGLAPGDGEP
jgi:uncharacterized protein YndB with AHSA1/START domain